MRKVPRKVLPEGTGDLRKVLAEGFCGRFRGRFFRKVCSKLIFFFAEGSCGRFLRKVLRKVFAEGSRGRFLKLYSDFAEGSCGRFLQKVPRKVFAEGSRKVPGRFSAEGKKD